MADGSNGVIKCNGIRGVEKERARCKTSQEYGGETKKKYYRERDNLIMMETDTARQIRDLKRELNACGSLKGET